MMRVIVCAGLVCVASAAERPRFDAASITPNASSTQFFSVQVQSSPEPVTLTMKNVSLKRCVQQAYSVKEYQVSGPGWIATAKYDIVATLSPGTAQDHVWTALQALLAERLKLSMAGEKGPADLCTDGREEWAHAPRRGRRGFAGGRLESS